MATEATLFKPKVIGGFAQRGHRRRKKRPARTRLPLTIKQILAWADVHHERTGKWPNVNSGRVYDAPSLNWKAVTTALRMGYRGLPGGSSLARLLAEQRGVRNRLAPPPLSIKKILAWADAHHKRTGKWPGMESGRVHGVPSETWDGVNAALRKGRRGLFAGGSLARLLVERRGIRSRIALPELTIRKILAWADAYHTRTGNWPQLTSGQVYGQPFEKWSAIHYALNRGIRGLPGGSSLVRLLARHRGVRNRSRLPKLTIRKILSWMDAYHNRTGRWPNAQSGPVEGAVGETWRAVETALRKGLRGLPGGSSPARLLERYRGVRNPATLPSLRVETVLKWADAHYRRTGRWPTVTSDLVQGTRNETWSSINSALHHGRRGLPGGLSLNLLLAKYRGVPKRVRLPMLTEKRILAWADAYHRRTGTWPNRLSGRVGHPPGITWRPIDGALLRGLRGLPGGTTLRQLLIKHGRIKPDRRPARRS